MMSDFGWMSSMQGVDIGLSLCTPLVAKSISGVVTLEGPHGVQWYGRLARFLLRCSIGPAPPDRKQTEGVSKPE